MKPTISALLLILALLFTNCNSNITQQATLSVEPTASATPTSAPPQYQLTFVADQPRKGYPGVYAMDVGCLDQEIPCFSEPYLLFEKSSPQDIYFINWSPNGNQLAYEGVEEYADIFISDWNGENTINITNSDSWDSDPVWMPDGFRIIFESEVKANKAGLILFDLGDQKKQELLMQINLNQPKGVVITPDSKKVIFMAHLLEGNLAGKFQIFISDLDGSNLVQLTEDPANYLSPSLSPDGSRIVIEQEYDTEAGYSNLVEICLDGSCFNEITERKEGVATKFPAWAPFGDWIAYSYNNDIYVTKSDGSITVRLTQTSFDEACPAWRIFSP